MMAKIECGDYTLRLGRTLVMGILNVTPDSFYDGGRNLNYDAAVEHAMRLASEGADIIDVGGESSRPGAVPVSAKEEAGRIVPVIKALSSNLDIPLSVDSYTPEVVRAAITAGASMVNDIYGLRSKGMAEAVASSGLPVVVMHMQGTPSNMQDSPKYTDIVSDIVGFFKERVEFAGSIGIADDRIILDPGIGFGKTTEHNLAILKNIREFKKIGLPLLVGHSRKSFIGNVLGIPVEDRLPATLGVTAYCALNGVDVLRVHDVKENVGVIRLLDRVLGSH
ncbi:MAG: dihydropteroate synthase [Candidatus Altiarchaeota archaeon]